MANPKKIILVVSATGALLGGATSSVGQAPVAAPPRPLVEAVGFTAETLKPFDSVLSAVDRETLVRLSTQVMQGERVALVSTVAGALAARSALSANDSTLLKDLTRRTSLTSRLDTPESWTGSGLADAESLPSLPRLASNAFQALPPLTPETSPEADLFEHPERVCTVALGPALTIDSTPDVDLDAQLGVFDLPLVQLDALTNILGSPNPLGPATFADLGLPDEEGLDADRATTIAAFASDDALQDDDALADPLDAKYGSGKEKALNKALSEREMPLADYLVELARLPAYATTFQDSHSSLAQALKALQGALKSIEAARLECQKAGFIPHGARRLSDEVIQVFACVDPTGSRVGISYDLQGEGLLPLAVRISAHDARTRRRVDLGIDQEVGGQGAVTLTAFQDGVPRGPAIAWTLSGKPAALSWSAADDDGEYTNREWHESGALRLEAKRRGDGPSGPVTTWYPSGAKWTETDPAMTVQKHWFESGKVAEEAPFQHGNLHGVRRLWHENGQLAAEVHYQNGVADGAFALYYANGTKGVQGTMLKGTPAGPMNWWYEQGTPLFSGAFANAELDGAQRIYRPSGKVLAERQFARGLPEGEWRSFDEGGKAVRSRTFRGGQPEGLAFVRYPDGKPLLDLHYQGGRLQGSLVAYFKDGQKATTCTYDQGELVTFARYAPTGGTSLSGSVEDSATGAASFKVLRPTGAPMLACRFSHFEVEECTLTDQDGDPIAMPTEKDVFTSPADPADTLKWKPESCGGAAPRWRFDDLIDGQGTQVDLTYETAEACPDAALADALHCALRLEGSRLSLVRCRRISGSQESDAGDAEVAH